MVGESEGLELGVGRVFNDPLSALLQQTITEFQPHKNTLQLLLVSYTNIYTGFV